ncbi:unnamed protein product, partial [marine sediment metagenome]
VSLEVSGIGNLNASIIVIKRKTATTRISVR